MDLAFPGNDLPAELGDLVHARTEGSPLFMADLLSDLRDRGVIVRDGDRWAMGRSLPDVADDLPESVRSMIQRRIEQLDEADVQLLLAASVQGNEFDSAIVAEALDLDAALVEDRLEQLDRVQRFVREVEERELPDGTLTLRYRFVHVLYQNAIYGSLRPARRTRLSRAVADALVRHHGEEDGSVAAELALLCESAREHERAASFFLVAARHAVRIFANREAATLAQRGLDRIPSLPASDARDRLELELLLTLGPPLKDTYGWAAPEVTAAYARASELGERIGGTPELFPALWGMWLAYSATAALEAQRTMGERLLRVAAESGDAGFLLQAHHALATTHFMAGDFTAALRHADQGRALYDPTAHHEHAFVYGGHDPGACCSCFAAQSLWMLGYADRALEVADAGLAIAERLGHPVSIALTHYCVGVLHQMRGDVRRTREEAELCRRYALDQGAPIFPVFLLAWSNAQEGRYDEALEQMRAAETHLKRIPIWWQVYFHSLVAEIHGEAENFEDALASVQLAFAAIGNRERGTQQSELHRLEGALLHASTPSRPKEAERALRRAVELARQQQARLPELRALVTLGHLLADEGRAQEIREELTDRIGWFTEGLYSPDLREARALLETIS
jgi:tetratricopeptide (TPR) repeat protein